MVAHKIPNPSFWAGKKVLLTGHTGFKGAWMALWLERLGSNVLGVALPPENDINLFDLLNIENRLENHFIDITNASELEKAVARFNPDIILHLAAQALVRESYTNPLNTFAANVMGTANLLNAARYCDATKVIVAITTDKVYKNPENFYPFRESDVLGGHDPYSASKAASEMVIASYRSSFLEQKGVALASARAGNVIGGGDWCKDRLIPDAVRAWSKDQVLEIRSPQAVRPWQHVLEPLNGYLALAEKLWENPDLAGAYNFGPNPHEAMSVREVIATAQTIWGSAKVDFAKSNDGPHEAGLLTLETSKTSQLLQIEPRWSAEQALERTMNWYKNQLAGSSAGGLCDSDIDSFIAENTISATAG